MRWGDKRGYGVSPHINNMHNNHIIIIGDDKKMNNNNYNNMRNDNTCVRWQSTHNVWLRLTSHDGVQNLKACAKHYMLTVEFMPNHQPMQIGTEKHFLTASGEAVTKCFVTDFVTDQSVTAGLRHGSIRDGV